MANFNTPTGRGNSFTVVSSAPSASEAVDKWVWIAPRKCKLIGMKSLWATAGGASAVVRPRKLTTGSGDAPGAAAAADIIEMTAADIDLTATANTVVETNIVETSHANYFDEGDILAENYGGTVSPIAGLINVYRFVEL
ncbi:MAG TPA: hypothetical protein VLA89_15900 [Gemmatimonadales bacterium]|nr:hypothetical protein [Gemmatimonadales bacterium]